MSIEITVGVIRFDSPDLFKTEVSAIRNMLAHASVWHEERGPVVLISHDGIIKHISGSDVFPLFIDFIFSEDPEKEPIPDDAVDIDISGLMEVHSEWADKVEAFFEKIESVRALY